MKKGLLPVFGILVAVFTGVLAGDTLWTRRYDGPAHSDEMACGVFTDAERNVIVLGSSPGTTTAFDIVVLKYSPGGDSLWVNRIAGPGTSNDIAQAGAVDASGAIYLTATTGTYPDYNILTLKLNPDGSEAWRATYQGSAGKNDEPSALVIDGNGNVYVTGYETDATNITDFVTIKYNADGTQAWSVNYDGGSNDKAVDLALGPGGTVYVTGTSTQGSYTDYATVKYNTSGGEEWVMLFNGSGNASDVPVAIAVDNSGNAYVTGATATAPPPGGHYNYATVKYDANGNEVWSKVQAFTNQGAEPAAMVLNSSALYITGKVMRTNYDFATVAYNLETGDTLWLRFYNSPANRNDVALKVCFDQGGRIHILGNSQDTLGRNDYCRVRYSADGLLELQVRFNSSFNNDEQAAGIAVDNEFNVVVTGRSYGGMPVMSYDIWTVKSDSAVPGVAESAGNQVLIGRIKAQPNPARTRTLLNLNLINAGDADLILYDVTGARCRELKIHLPPAGNFYPLSLAGLNPGIYILEVKQADISRQVKVQVVK